MAHPDENESKPEVRLPKPRPRTQGSPLVRPAKVASQRPEPPKAPQLEDPKPLSAAEAAALFQSERLSESAPATPPEAPADKPDKAETPAEESAGNAAELSAEAEEKAASPEEAFEEKLNLEDEPSEAFQLSDLVESTKPAPRTFKTVRKKTPAAPAHPGEASHAKAVSTSRRSALGSLLGLMAIGGGLYPVVRAVTQPGEQASDESQWTDVLSASALNDELPKLDTPKAFKVKRRVLKGWKLNEEVFSVFLTRHGADIATVSVMSSVCPHAGCLVDFERKEKRFVCPCHRASFAADGKRTSEESPAPRGLDRFETRIHNNTLQVKLERFRLNVGEADKHKKGGAA